MSGFRAGHEGKRTSSATLKHISLILACTIMLILTLSGALTHAQASTAPTFPDVTYCTAGGMDLKMDVYLPASSQSTSASRPTVVYVHGGGWVSGDKRTGAGALDFSELLSRGYVVGSLNYRLAPQYKFPAQIEDVKCAIRSLRANSAKYHIDPEHIGAWGGSAGGHLVSLLGVADQSAGFDVGQYLNQSSRVQAVVDYFGPSNLTSGDFANGTRQLILSVFGSQQGLVSGSPVTYVTKDDPPFLIVQGEMDVTVPPHQSQELYYKLIKAGVPATLVMVKNAGHGFTPVGGPISPTRQEISKLTADFFDHELESNVTIAKQNSALAAGLQWQTPVLVVLVIVILAIAILAAFRLRRR
jgi:acetyl esterase/lipase